MNDEENQMITTGRPGTVPPARSTDRGRTTNRNGVTDRRSWLGRGRGVAVLVAVVIALVASACGSDIGEGATGDKPNELVVITYDSYVLPEAAAKEFEERTGTRITLIQHGDSADMLTGALLSAGSPEGDVIFGIDNTLASRALGSDLLEPVDPSVWEKVPSRYRLGGAADDRLVAIDHGEVCMNVDSEWFAAHDMERPTTLEDLTEPTYSGLTVLSSPVTSGPGMAFLTGTIAAFGEDGWQDYWRALAGNGVVVRPSWSDAYYNDYTASGGTRPVVLSYASSPPAEVIFSEGRRQEPVSVIMEASCVEQVEYAGVLAGTQNPLLAEDLLRTMLSRPWQEQLPLVNFVYPVMDVDLPDEFTRWAPPVGDPLSLPSDVIDANREAWIDEWRSLME